MNATFLPPIEGKAYCGCGCGARASHAPLNAVVHPGFGGVAFSRDGHYGGSALDDDQSATFHRVHDGRGFPGRRDRPRMRSLHRAGAGRHVQRWPPPLRLPARLRTPGPADVNDSLFSLTRREVDCIAVAYGELLSYFETVGYEGSLDDEEMPSEKIPETLSTLRNLLDRYAKFEELTAQAARHGGVVEVAPVRFEYHSDTPPSGPRPS
jgi:hypothetical protein